MSPSLDASTSTFTVPPVALSNDFDNMKAIEQWAGDYMRATSSSSRCHLFIPHKQLSDLSPTLSLDNWNAIERWANSVITGSCGFSPFSSSCHLFIPFKTVLGDLQAGRIMLPTAQAREFSNYKAVEDWANRLHRGEC